MAEDRRPLPGRAGGRPPGWLRRAAEGGAAREEPHVARVPEDAALEALPDREAQLLVEDRHRLAAQRVALLRLRAERVLIEPSHGGGAAGVEAVLEEELRVRAGHDADAHALGPDGPRPEQRHEEDTLAVEALVVRVRAEDAAGALGGRGGG